LSFIEDCLQIPNWEKTVETINQLSPGRSWGGWKPGVDYMRLDGSTSSADRGKLIKRFNSKPESHQVFDASSNNVKLFLISVRAGSVGTNLVAANRVVLFDSSWNPAVDYQAIYRCYRYGQTKPVYAYRFLTDDTMEQKVYSRIVNKTAIAARVIDKKQPQRNFTSRELDDILAIDTWVQCNVSVSFHPMLLIL
jgi:transcriptional regulator ATRX